MRILVFSDTHGFTGGAVSAANAHPDAEEIIHLGDHIRDAYEIERRTGKPVTAVPGNCDYASDAPESLLIVRGGCRLFLTHGSRYGVKYSLLRLSLAAAEQAADAALFGHTHQPALEYENGVLLLNPGSVSQPRGCKRSCAILDITGGVPSAKIVTL